MFYIIWDGSYLNAAVCSNKANPSYLLDSSARTMNIVEYISLGASFSQNQDAPTCIYSRRTNSLMMKRRKSIFGNPTGYSSSSHKNILCFKTIPLILYTDYQFNTWSQFLIKHTRILWPIALFSSQSIMQSIILPFLSKSW